MVSHTKMRSNTINHNIRKSKHPKVIIFVSTRPLFTCTFYFFSVHFFVIPWLVVVDGVDVAGVGTVFHPFSILSTLKMVFGLPLTARTDKRNEK